MWPLVSHPHSIAQNMIFINFFKEYIGVSKNTHNDNEGTGIQDWTYNGKYELATLQPFTGLNQKSNKLSPLNLHSSLLYKILNRAVWK